MGWWVTLSSLCLCIYFLWLTTHILRVFGLDSISIKNSQIKNNKVGIQLFANDSILSVSKNTIHDNTINGVESYAEFTANLKNNFWGDASGPYNEFSNPEGLGNGIISSAVIICRIFSFMCQEVLIMTPRSNSSLILILYLRLKFNYYCRLSFSIKFNFN